MSSPYNTKASNPYNQVNKKEQGMSSYNPSSGTLTSGTQSYSVAPEKASSMLSQVEVKSSSSSRKKSSGGSSKKKGSVSVPEQSSIFSSSGISDTPQNKSDSNSSRSQVNREAYLYSQSLSQVSRSSTVAPSVEVKQSSIVFEPLRQGTIESNVPSGSVDELDRGFSQARQEFKEQLLTQSNYEGPEVIKKLKTTGTLITLGASSVAVGTVRGVKAGVNFFIRPDKTIQGLSDTATLLVSNPKELGNQIKSDFLKNPVSFTTEQAVSIGTINKVPVVAKNLYVSKGAYAGSIFNKDINIYSTTRNVPVENVLDVSSLETPSYTQSKGIKDSVKSFEESKGIVQTSSQGKLNPDEIGTRGKGALELEDKGIYVNPKGRGSGAPLGVSGSSGYSLNPIKLVDNIFSVPTITVFETQGVIRYPRSIINTKGFTEVNKFGESVSGSGVAIITKRSELAFGEVRPQRYYNEKLGMSKIETGSAELEAVLPVGTKFEQVANNKFTTYKGRAVAIREAKVLTENSLLPKNVKVISGSKIVGEQKNFASSYKNLKTPQSVVYPYQKYSEPVLEYSLPMSIASSTSSSSRVESPMLIDSSPIVQSSGESSIPEISPSNIVVPSKKKSGGGSQRTVVPSVPITPSTPVIITPSVPKYPTSKVPVTPIIPEYPTKKKPIQIYKKKSPISSIGFDVFVRVRGQFKRINTGALSREEAINFGAFRVGNTASATFKIKPSNLGNTQTFRQKGFLQDFYSKEDLFIEKKQRRIKSQGELREITYKGIYSNKNIFRGKKWKKIT